MPPLEIRLLPIDQLVPAPYNPRKALKPGSPAYRKLRASLEGAREIVRRNQRLIRLRDELPSWSLEELALRVPDTPRLRELFAQWGFKTLLAQSGHQPPQSPESPVQGALL